MKRLWPLLAALAICVPALGQEPVKVGEAKEVYSSTSCMGCHGMSAMGGLGPPIAATKLTDAEVTDLVRKGKGMMPGTPQDQLSDADLQTLIAQVKAMPVKPDEIPLAFKIGQMLTTKNVSHIFMLAGIFSLVFIVRSIVYWVGLAGLRALKPAIRKFGTSKAWGVFIKACLTEGLFVTSLYKKDRFRWLMHGLMLYGFLGLALADILMQIVNPTRADLALTNPLKVLPIVCGITVLVGSIYVMYRYKKDPYIDNGVTLGKDYLFATLLLHAALSGTLTLVVNRSTAYQWVMPIYIYHLSVVLALIVSAPFTRFQHMWVAPIMLSLTRVTEAVTDAGADIGLVREPAPGRHHKTMLIAQGVLNEIGEDPKEKVVIRYFP